MNKCLSLNDWNLIYDKLLPFVENISEAQPSDQITKISISQSNIQMSIQWLKKSDDYSNCLDNSQEMVLFPYVLDIQFELCSNLNEFAESKQNAANLNENAKPHDKNDEYVVNEAIETIETAQLDEIIEINGENGSIEVTGTAKVNERNEMDDGKNEKDGNQSILVFETAKKPKLNDENKINTKIDHKPEAAYVILERINIQKYLPDTNENHILAKKRSYSTMKDCQRPLKSLYANVLNNDKNADTPFSISKCSTPKPQSKTLLISENTLRNVENDENNENMKKTKSDILNETFMVLIKKKYRKVRPLHVNDAKTATELNNNEKLQKSRSPKTTKSNAVKMPRRKHEKRIVSMNKESSLFEGTRNQTISENKIL